MAQRSGNETEYRFHGSAAVEPAYQPEPEIRPEPKRRPQHRPQPRPRKKPASRQKMVVAPFALVGIGLSLIMLVLVLFGYAQVYESSSHLGDMEDRVATLREENSKLRNQYDSSIDLESIEERAGELGMRQPTTRQIITLSVPAEDVAVVNARASTNPLRAAWDAVTETARELLEYLRQ